MKQPCDEAVMRAGTTASPCAEKSRPWVLVATILGSSMAFIDSTVVNVALPALQSDLHATVVDVQWVIESYGLFLSALILVGGALGDSLGRRAMFLLGIVGFALALGVLYQCSARCGCSCDLSVARSRIPQLGHEKCRLAGRRDRDSRVGGTGIRISRIRGAGLDARSRDRQSDCRLWIACPVCMD